MIDFTKFIEFISNNHVALVGAVAAVCEIIVIIVNTIKKLTFNSQLRNFDVKALKHGNSSSTKAFAHVLWVINPLNILRKP